MIMRKPKGDIRVLTGRIFTSMRPGTPASGTVLRKPLHTFDNGDGDGDGQQRKESQEKIVVHHRETKHCSVATSAQEDIYLTCSSQDWTLILWPLLHRHK